MMSVQELTEKYRGFSDEELIRTHAKIEEYSPEAKLAMDKILLERGGVKTIEDKIEKQQEMLQKEKDIKYTISVLVKQGKTKMEILKEIGTDFFNVEKINSIVDEMIAGQNKILKDKKITFRAIVGSLLGALVGGTISGIIWGVQMIYSQHMFVLIAIGLALFCYFMVRVFANKSKKNVIVIIATVLAIIYALLLGELLYGIFGYIPPS